MPTTSRRNVILSAAVTDAGAGTMTNRFPTPWRMVEMPSGFAVEDATGQQLGVFYGRCDPNIAGHTGYLTIDEARELAINFAKLPELFKRNSTRGEFAKATPHLSRAGVQKQNGGHPPTPLRRLRTSSALQSKIVATVQRHDTDQ
jgi:hypothetical protein